jgi:hypothetical protein
VVGHEALDLSTWVRILLRELFTKAIINDILDRFSNIRGI